MSKVLIRDAAPTDEPAILELLEELDRSQLRWRIFPPRPSYRADLVGRYRGIREDRDAIHLVAEEDGRVVGMAVGILHRPSSISDALALEVSSFVVREAHRGRGIGRTLASDLVRFAAKRGIRHLDLRVFASNHRAVAFWRRLGFEPRILQMVAGVDAAESRAGSPAP